MLQNQKNGFMVTGQLLAAGIFFLLVGIFSFNFFSDYQADTSILIEPRADHFSLEENVVIDIFVVSRTPLNAVDVALTFPKEYLRAIDIEKNDGVFDLWVVEPTFSNEEGTVLMTGGTTRPGGVVGKVYVASVVFKPLKTGSVMMSFSHSLVLAHDGEGTDLREDSIDAAFIVESLQKQKVSSAPKMNMTSEYVITEKPLPSPDVNNDGYYSIKDLSAFLSGIGKEYNEKNDLNQDGKIGLKDASIILSKMFRGD